MHTTNSHHTPVHRASAPDSRAQRLADRRAANHAALGLLFGKPGDGLKIWRKLRGIERDARNAATAQCNGESYNGQPYRDNGPDDEGGDWDAFCDAITARVRAITGKLPDGFFCNTDPRGHALKISPEVAALHPSLQTDWGGNGILAAEIND